MSTEYFAGYVPKSAQFAADGSNAWDRYEADPGHTDHVDVKASVTVSAITPMTLAWRYPGESEWKTSAFTAAAGTAEYALTVPIPMTVGAEVIGQKIELAIREASSGVDLATSSITYSRGENGSNNPLWKDERTVETLAWGEWTADMDTATQKVAQAEGEAWTLVELAGSLWCPDCYRTDVNFLEDGGKVAAWAKARKVALVSVDTPHNSAADPDPANPVGTIWSRDTDATKLIIPPFGNADLDKVERSGKGYLSRKMISDEDALAVARCNLWLSKDYFHRPEDYATHRTLIPIFILLNKAGEVVGRFETFDARSQSPTTRENTERYLARFDEMIAAAKASGDPSGEVADNHWSTTDKALAVDAAPLANEISHADYQDVWELRGVAAGMIAKVFLTGTAAAPAYAEVVEVRDNVATVIASASGVLSPEGFAVEAVLNGEARRYVRVFCHPGDDTNAADAYFAAISGGSTRADYTMRLGCIVVPQEVKATVSGCADYAVRLENGVEYVFEGLDPERVAGRLTAVEGQPNHYVATVSGDVRLAVSGMFSYQLWRPGCIAFDDVAVRAFERDGAAAVRVSRLDGTSDRSEVTVTVVSAENAEGRYSLLTRNLVWESGEVGTKEIQVALIDNGNYDDEGRIVLGLAPVGGCAATVAADARAAVTIVDTDKPIFGKSSYAVTVYRGFGCGEVFDVCNVNGKKAVKIGTSAKLPTGLKMKFDKQIGAVVLSGAVGTKATSVSFSSQLTQGKDTGLESSFDIVVKDPTAYNPFVGVKRGTQTIPLFAETESGRVVAGTLTVVVSAKNSVSAKYIGTERKSLSFRGSWTGLDESTGEALVTFASKGVVLNLGMAADGSIRVVMTGPTAYSAFLGEGQSLTGTAPYPAAVDFSAWKGAYSLALPVLAVSDASAPSGIPGFTLTMTSPSSARKGKVTYKGTLADGSSVSGSVQLMPGDEVANLFVFKRSGKNVFGGAFAIAPDGSVKWNDASVVVNREVVNPVDGTVGYCLHRDGVCDYTAVYDICGSWYPQSVGLGDIVAAFYVNPETRFAVEIGSVRVGTVAWNGKKFGLVDKGTCSTFKVTQKTGVFSGAAEVMLPGSAAAVKGTLKGVLVPGWYENCDCGIVPKEIPFGDGAFSYSEKVGKKTVKRSVPVILREL